MNITLLGCVAGAVLLALPLYVIYAFQLRVLQRYLRSLACMAVAVAACGGAVSVLMHSGGVWPGIVAGVALAVLGAVVTSLRSHLPMRQVLVPVMIAGVLPLFVVALYVAWLVLGVGNPLDTRFFVPLLGVLVGTASGLVARALRTYYAGVAHHNELYLYLLGNGATHREAVRHFMRRGFQAALVPVMKRMSTTCLTTAPAMMLALVMGGTPVWTACVVEVTAVAAVTVYALATFWGAVVLSRRYAFDEYERLKPADKPSSAPDDKHADNNPSSGDTEQDGTATEASWQTD